MASAGVVGPEAVRQGAVSLPLRAGVCVCCVWVRVSSWLGGGGTLANQMASCGCCEHVQWYKTAVAAVYPFWATSQEIS